MERKLENAIGNTREELANTFDVDWKIEKHPERKRWFALAATIAIKDEDGNVVKTEQYEDGGRDELKLMERFQARLGGIGTRKNIREGFDTQVPVGEIRDSIAPSDFQEMR